MFAASSTYVHERKNIGDKSNEHRFGNISYTIKFFQKNHSVFSLLIKGSKNFKLSQ